MTFYTLRERVVSCVLSAGILAAAVASCSSDPDATPTSVLPTSTPEPTATQPPATATPAEVMSVPTSIATAFVEWGPTCLNGVYPPNAPTLEEVDVSDYIDGVNGLKYQIIKEGEGETPSPDWEVDVLYTGWLESGCIFDSSYTRSEPTIFPVKQVIPGWQLSITEMKIGERRRVEIPPQLAYGPTGSPPVIPADATLTFDIILVGGTSKDAADAIATQAAEELFAVATQEARSFDPESIGFAPITDDYFIDVDGFLAAIPIGEVACMTAHAGGEEEIRGVFSAQQRAPREDFVDQIDDCLSETTARNIVVGRILVVGGTFSDETLSCMERSLPDPTLKPLFGIFSEPSISKQWISTHFCMTSEERVAFDEALYAGDPQRQPSVSGLTYVDVQECMIDELGESYFEPAPQPDPNDQAALDAYYESFSSFLVADLRCNKNEEGWPLEDQARVSADAAQCIIDDIGAAKFGEAMLGRSWSPDGAEHVAITSSFMDCGVETDFLELPGDIATLSVDALSCLTAKLSNTPDPAEASLTAFAELGRRGNPKAGDLSTFIFGAQACEIPVQGLPSDEILSESEVQCIVGQIDQSVYTQGRSAIFAGFLNALTEVANCTGS